MSGSGIDLEMRNLFMEEGRALLEQMRTRLEAFQQQADPACFGEVSACGFTLRGSGALIGLTAVSQAGAILSQAAEIAAACAADDREHTGALVAAMLASLPMVHALLERGSNEDVDGEQRLLAAIVEQFPAADRPPLRSAEDRDITRFPSGVATETSVASPSMPDAIAAEVRQHLVDLLMAHAQLDGSDRDLEHAAEKLGSTHAQLVALPASDEAHPTSTLLATEASTLAGRCVDIIAQRVAATHSFQRAVAGIHRSLGAALDCALPIESLVLLDVDGSLYGLPEKTVEAVHLLPAASLMRSGHEVVVQLGQERLPGLDLGALVGKTTDWVPSVAVVVRVPAGRFAVLVGAAGLPRPMVLRPLDDSLSSHALLRHATIGPRGEAVLVLDAEALFSAMHGPASH